MCLQVLNSLLHTRNEDSGLNNDTIKVEHEVVELANLVRNIPNLIGVDRDIQRWL